MQQNQNVNEQEKYKKTVKQQMKKHNTHTNNNMQTYKIPKKKRKQKKDPKIFQPTNNQKKSAKIRPKQSLKHTITS